jgi:hypothetical protein
MTDEKAAGQLMSHELGTYHSLRVILATIGLALPIVVTVAGWYQCQPSVGFFGGSLSAYYHRLAPFEFLSARDLFAGGLFAAAVCLFSYKGFSTKENVALNLAAVFAVGVALLPTAHGPSALNVDEARNSCIVFVGAGYHDSSLRPILHGTSAVLFFLCLAYVSIWRSRDTLRLLNEAKRESYNRRYMLTGALMIASPIAAVVASKVLTGSHRIFILSVEALGVWAFSVYWWVKTREMGESNVDVRIATGQVKRAVVPSKPPAKAFDRALRKIQVLNADSVERIVPVDAPPGHAAVASPEGGVSFAHAGETSATRTP